MPWSPSVHTTGLRISRLLGTTEDIEDIMSHHFHSVALLLLTVSATACGPRLAKLDVNQATAIAVSAADHATDLCPLQPKQLHVRAMHQNGAQQATWVGKKRDGALSFSEFHFQTSIGQVDRRGYLHLPTNQLASLEQPVTVRVTAARQPALNAEFTFAQRYNCGGVLDLRGRPGFSGDDGEHGTDGEPGPELEIALGYIDTQQNGRLVLARIQSNPPFAQPHYMIIDTRGPTAPTTVDASGGDGGSGGSGEDGEDGYDGRDGADGDDGDKGTRDSPCSDGQDGAPGEDGGHGGHAGDGGDGGHGGHGGHVILYYDQRFPELAQAVRVKVDGGRAGRGGWGGNGGRGGSGGDGGDGGSRGYSTDGSQCNATRGQDGEDGADGEDGEGGERGQHGVAGEVGSIRALGQDVQSLFAAEIADGVAIPVEPAAP